ncbi:hypothetical protein H257_04109 [Aphanomyces astaci]|uniref:J domain-containing protein n=2 Tax=Aphanomyces astaci TaxID=112090 RepID=W4GWF8_APHAT|nr:hypothetical protein H257_04109 [Aphanomyces astaci]ETV83364.1 hypothetical protein H257_04109 [Aphanomyces astaci]RHX96794.1 hypothetical protein DYB25_008764 [Aphanomyces astaci]RHY40615.1 hypothetical protein DYB38_011976 [Aphanomyces astaci]RHY99843.1 hypothetical protein DYB35_013491 [Aphanomyces astaci]RHZ34259.1 hypothetical protein DYB37_013468 [Aphanomyces astaci]|eukprot:XP_009826794.1 hypothetical protein H257_04109 [Aphanomyces astaci]
MGHGQFVSTMLVHTTVVNPGLNWIRAPGRFSKSVAILYSIGFLIAIASVSIGYEVANNPPNFYVVMGVSRDTPFSEIKKAYRSRSVELHPDKNPSPNAADEFKRLRLAYDVLSDSTKRDVYDFYGEDDALKEEGKAQSSSDLGQITSLLSYYVVWAILTYVLTLGDAPDVRAWAYSGCLLMLVAEINITLAKVGLSKAFFPQITVYELVQFMHLLYPPFMNGCRSMGAFYVRNLVQENYDLSIELLKSNKMILMGMRQLNAELQGLGHPPRRPKTQKQHPSVVGAPPDGGVGQQPTAEEAELIQPSPAINNAGGFAVPKFVYAIGFYLVMNYIFG